MHAVVTKRDSHDPENSITWAAWPMPLTYSVTRRLRPRLSSTHNAIFTSTLVDAGKFGLEIRHVFLTHFHADFVAGHLELRDRCGATIRLGARAKAEYAFVSMKDGDTLEFPGLRVQVLETPGHTIESISILVFDLEKDPTKPHAVLTGDTLFIGDVGRPDLRASLGWTANKLAAHLYESLRDKLLTLPDGTLVYPAHGAGSLCGKQLSSDTVSWLGDQRCFNYALQPMSEEVFVRLVTADLPDAPHTSLTMPS
jgi:hydroxyacylglutathione hydrolase